MPCSYALASLITCGPQDTNPFQLKSVGCGRIFFGNQYEAQAVLRAVVPVGINTEAELPKAISGACNFPEYFDGHWDAFNECIRDLSWLPPGDVILIHEDLPLLEDRYSLSVYLKILADAIANWNTNGSNLIFASPETYDPTGKHAPLVKRRLVVIFPSEVRGTVKKVLAERKNRSSPLSGGR